ncbi:hypothetical protein H8356DRAFT_1396166 [Neocallimastix lanati (nom. inval.)]|nr:hypothetical protein H8356DRAFT_1396166 [Neocallimastix sp. JGI-2020a]
MKYHEDIYEDDTFYISPKFSYQVFITRKYIKKLKWLLYYFVFCFSILKSKEQATYEILFEDMKKEKKKNCMKNSLIKVINICKSTKRTYGTVQQSYSE